MSANEAMRQREDEQAETIKLAVKAACELRAASEMLRERIDQLEAMLTKASNLGCAFPPASIEKSLHRVDAIRRHRNAMEAFELECRIKKDAEKAWEALP